MAKTKAQTFSTRHDAEVWLAENDQAGKQKPQRCGSRWYLVQNTKGTINRSLFTEMLRVGIKRQARKEQWRGSEVAMALADVPRRAAKLWREVTQPKREVAR